MTGTILGNRYELLQKIGEGGMAEVYKAKCHLLNRYVAVKILKNQYSDNMEFVNKFKQEAAAAASLSHNNIVGIYDIGSENNINYIVMEYIDGKTLKQIINENQVLKYNKAIEIASQIAKALECAHNNNIIHRDVKPHNILVTKDGIIKVTDFGIAKATSSVTITNSDKIIGSAHYISPEQAKGKFVDCKTDIYSLGIILYEMVTGEVPYDGESPVSVALKHVQEQVIPPIKVNPNIPESLNKLILKAVEKEPYKRYQSAHDILMDLEKIQQNPNTNIAANVEENEYTKIMSPIPDVDENFKDNKAKELYNGIEDDDTKYEKFKDDLKNNKKKNVIKSGNSDKNKKKLIGGIILLAVIIIGFVGIFMVTGGKKKSGKVKIPNVIGMTKEEAEKLAKDSGLKFVFEEESSDKPKGVIIKCYPAPGQEIDLSDNDEVRAIVSSGEKKSGIPNLIGIDFEAAKEYLKSYNLKLGKVTHEYNNNIGKGKVCNQSPKPGSELEESTTIDLVISKGTRLEMTTVPNLINKKLDEAQTLISSARLKLGTINKIPTTDKDKDGIVSVQSIEPNSRVRQNTVINITCYSFGDKDVVSVPNFVNKTVKEARELAAQSNVSISVKGREDFVITSQDKTPGTAVSKGTNIILNSEPNP
ncbi:Stk1 family PASTA domain-containing Ser/Thr kinase [Clostridium botulinum C]|uniref:non-specific serine/threonine protein kinase n=3 Tax=Clostridium TaxID=1485 RepID=A0A9Q4TLT0_CLOBO|nr:Stk1 family PASTA domain-containing Ser/Thr kinase [Clostridium botulinum]MCD3194395.1 Stk1 family PASTA domain-containing Ser/Thr kinase [Clostridium botulinum C]MCD3199549.1 Stk1 family PASTA domain-containing Ser/Thr kinase [Clostridium botulinum C]MCD3205024.1 Stk1 family PASTA domain-containing Ser/Thr kinase [Clostridium botulinum C]MCD3207842.1 Stk1 family PASTA domain-containing Ser/Thr kinase [Clostridium botulinum C]MCD3225307.1 Stk1 family PASTA domain-containing Ser/Thr kinase [